VNGDLAKFLVPHLYRLVHDVKSPLNAVNGRLFLALRKTTDETAIRNILLAELGTRNLLRRLYNLFDIAAIETGRKHLEDSPTDLASAVSEPLAFWRRIGDVQHVGFNIAIPEGLLVKANKTGIERIFDNIVSNVFSHAEEASVISFMTEATEGNINLTIRNDGVSASEETISPSEPDMSEGATINGLGLVCVKRMMEHWGGTLEARVTAGGDAFIVVLSFLRSEG